MRKRLRVQKRERGIRLRAEAKEKQKPFLDRDLYNLIRGQLPPIPDKEVSK